MNYIKQTLVDTFEIFAEELKHVFRDSGVIVLFFAATLLYPVLYGFIYKNETIYDVSIAVIDKSHSSKSRQFIRKINATPELKVYTACNSMEEAKQLYAKNAVNGIVYIPKEFSDDIARGKQTKVLAYANMSSMMYYKAVYAGVTYASLDMGSEIQMKNLVNSGLTKKESEITATPIRYEGHALYNPLSGFPSFLLPAVLILILQQTLVLGIGMLAGTAREENSFHQLIPYQRKYHGTLRIVCGKALAYLLLYTFIACYNLILIPYVFNIPHLITWSGFIGFVLPYLLACIFFGMGISVFFWKRENSLLLYLWTSLPLLFISGFSWPSTHIHTFWKTVSYFFPSTFGVQGFIKMNSMGAGLSQVSTECLSLWIQTGVYFIFSFFVYRWQIMQSEKKQI